MIGIEIFPPWIMKKIIVQIKSLTIAISCLVTNIMAYEIEHLEPPFWWTGMESEKLQLMVHGRNISFLQPQIEYEGVEILRVNRMNNNNYLFIDLSLKDAVAGSFDIQFIRLGKVEAEYRYVLHERDSNSKYRSGFGPGDVIYLITPDRYANGDKKNDDVSGLKEKSRREDKDGRHGGDIQGIIDRLDYLEQMGFTQLWLNPVLENNQSTYSYHGYSTTDYYNIDSRFGNNKLYLELSEKARERGMGIIKDLILNHIGSGHWWMDDLPSEDWINNGGKFIGTNHIHESVHDPHLTKSEKNLFTDGWFVKSMPDLNQRNELLETYLIQASIWWIEYANLSGFRVDTYPYVDKDFLSTWSMRLATEYPNFNFVGEEWSSNSTMVSYWQKDSKRHDDYVSFIPSMMDFPLQNALIKGLLEKDTWDSGIGNIFRVLANDFQYGNPYNLVVFAGNHDMTRIYSLLNERMDLYKMAMSIICTIRGIPQIYYGTEIAMASTDDHGELRKDFPGGWPNDDKNAFTGHGLNERELDAQNYLKKLLNWRKNNLAIAKGDLIHYPVQDGIYVYFRRYENDMVMVIINNNDRAKTVYPDHFNETIKGRTKGVNIINDRLHYLSREINIPGKSTLVLEIH